MERVIAIIGIIADKNCSKIGLNAILSDFGEHIVARTGVPYREAGLNVISVMADAPADKINALSGKLGRLDGISTKTMILERLKEAEK